MGEGELESVWFGFHFKDFKGSLIVPADAFEGEGFSSPACPAAVAASDKEGAIIAKAHGDDAGAEAVQAFESSTLIDAVDFFEEDALYLGVSLFADEHLVRERSEFSVGLIVDDGCRGLSDFTVRKNHGGWDEPGDPFAFGFDT